MQERDIKIGDPRGSVGFNHQDTIGAGGEIRYLKSTVLDLLQEQIEGWKIKHYDHLMKHNAEGALVCKASINALEGFMARVREL